MKALKAAVRALAVAGIGLGSLAASLSVARAEDIVVTHYGSLAFDIARLANENPELGERVHADAPEIWAQVVYARDHEWAQTVDDVLRRRTTLTIRGLATDEVRGRVQDLLDRK